MQFCHPEDLSLAMTVSIVVLLHQESVAEATIL